MKKELYFTKVGMMLALLLGLGWTAMAQDRQISGTVSDAKGQGIQGVSVSVMGTSIRTISDVSGKFAITVKKPGDEILFANVGFI